MKTSYYNKNDIEKILDKIKFAKSGQEFFIKSYPEMIEPGLIYAPYIPVYKSPQILDGYNPNTIKKYSEKKISEKYFTILNNKK